MSVTITNTENELLFQRDLVMGAGNNSDGFAELAYSSNESFWKSDAKEFFLNGIHIAYHRVDIFETVKVQTVDHRPMPGLFFVEKGKIEIANSSGEPWHFTSREHNFLYNAYSTDFTSFPKQDDLQIFILSFTPERLSRIAEGNGKLIERLAESVITHKSLSLLKHRNLRIESSMHDAIFAIKNCSVFGSTRQLYLESKSLELLALQLQQFESADSQISKLTLTVQDKRKLDLVRQALESDLTVEHSLSSLAKMSGLNEFKLKAGFKLLYGVSVFGYLANYRLSKSDSELQTSNKSLTEIAYELGFASLQHFSAAYKKRYGISPGKRR